MTMGVLQNRCVLAAAALHALQTAVTEAAESTRPNEKHAACDGRGKAARPNRYQNQKEREPAKECKTRNEKDSDDSSGTKEQNARAAAHQAAVEQAEYYFGRLT